MATHGTPSLFGLVDISEYIYVQPTEDTTYDNYDALIAGKANTSSLSTVATSGSYTDLSSKPTIPAAQIQGDWNQTSAGALDYIKNKPAIPSITTRSFANPTRSLNTAFQVSTTRDALVGYSVDIATSVSLSGGAVGTVFLEYADDSGFTTNVIEVGRFVNGNTGTLVIGLTLNQTNTGSLSGIVPVSKYVRIRTANTSGSPTFNFRSSQEVLL